MSKKFTYYGGVQSSLLPYLTAYWTADNIATDVYTNNLGGSFTGATYSTGINNNAFDFGSGSQVRYVDVPDDNLLSFTDGTNDVPFSISMWVYFYSFSGVGNWLVNKRQSNIEYQLIFYQNQIRFDKFSLGGTANSISTTTGYTPAYNQWVHLAYTDDGSKFGGKIYANGIDITASHTETGNYVRMINTNVPAYFGAAGFQLSYAPTKHRGMIDEVAIFNGTELTQLQVQDLYNGGVGKFYPNI